MFNTQEEREILLRSLKRSENIEETLETLGLVIDNLTPFALYIATADRSDCLWIFDPEVIYDMLGGEDIHQKTSRSLMGPEELGVLFYIFKKTGPLITVRIDLSTLIYVQNALKLDISHSDTNST